MPSTTRPPIILLAASLVALGLAGCFDVDTRGEIEMAGDTPETGVPFELTGPAGGVALVVPVYVNGTGPHDFVLDTGATMTCVDAALAAELGLEDAPGQLGVGMGIGQELGALRLVVVDSLRVGDATARRLTGCALDLGRFGDVGLPVVGLLGLNYLREFRVTLDFTAERLTLERP